MTDIFVAAKEYHTLGVPVIPFKITQTENGEYDKKNLSNWKKWQTEPQTQQEFETLNWKEANGFAVLLGTKATNGMYLSVIDHDTKGEILTEKIKQKGKTILKDFPITQTHKTTNNGLHYIYWSKTKTKTDGSFHDEIALELLGEKKLCVMSPSLGYKSLNDNYPTILESLEDKFYEIIKKAGYCHTEETEIENQLDSYSFDIKKIVDFSNLEKTGANEYQGSHPIHDSTTEKNFCVNIQKNSWHCFRHNSGGGALQYLAVKEGIIKCEQAKRGALRGKKFKQVLTLAAAQGLVDEKVLEQSEINPVILAKDLQVDYVFVTDENSNELYYYRENEGIYSNRTEQLIKREIAKRLDENFKSRYYNEIKEFITATSKLVKMNNENPEMLAVNNGLLNVLTIELTSFNPDIHITNKLTLDFNPEIEYKTSYNAQFLKDVIQKEIQLPQIQELIGHCLFKKIITETSLVCLGKGGNGKSVFLTTIKSFLGETNITSFTLQQLCYDQFKLVELKNKLANICADLPHKQLMNTGTYKSLVSGEAVPISIKHVQGKGEIIEPTAKYLYSANHLPPIQNEEDCYAWYRRFVFADFEKTFTPENSIPRQELLNKLSTPTEKSALLNWALEGLKRLIKNGDISDKPNVNDVRTEYRKRSSTTLAFFDDCVTVTDNTDDWVTTDDFFRDYVTYCHKKEIQTKTKGEFVKDIEQFLAGAKKARIRTDPKSNPVSSWRYIKSVPPVLDVSISETISAKLKKINTLKNYDSGLIVPEASTDGTLDTENSSVGVHCFGCRKPLGHHEVCTFGGKPYCLECRMKIEDQKKEE